MSPDRNTILIVEDEPDVADLYTHWLGDSYHVRTAYSGEQALEQLDPEVDIVLLDRRMPGLSGDEVLGRIRKHPGEYQVAMVTAVEPDFDILKLDFDEYLTKPISREELETAIEELLTRNTFERGLQEYLALAAKKSTLEEEKSSSELQNNTTYEILTAELATHREQINSELASLGERDTDAYFPYSKLTIMLSSIVVSLIAILLVVIHVAVPNPRERAIAFGTSQSDLLGSYLLTFVHVNDAHLVGNIVGYLGGALLALMLCLRVRAIRWFYLTTLLLLTALPMGTTFLSRHFFEFVFPNADPVFIGFSTVSAGFVGFSFLAFLIVGRVLYSHRTVFFMGTFILLISINLLLWVTHNQLLPIAILSTLLVMVVLIADNRNAISLTGGTTELELKRMLEQVLVVLSATALFGLFGLGLFPTTELGNSPHINVIGHLFGVVLGFGIALMTAFINDIFPIEDQLRRKGYSLPDRLL